MAELCEVANGRADLLAEVAGVGIGFAAEWNEPRARQAADLCRLAGADEALIPRWIEVGQERRANANLPPFSGGLHSGRGRPRSGGTPPGLPELPGYMGMRRTLDRPPLRWSRHARHMFLVCAWKSENICETTPGSDC